MPSVEEDLLKAVSRNDLVAVKSILSGEGAKEIANLGRSEWEDGESPLNEATWFGKGDIIRALVEGGLNVNSFVTDADNRWRYTALHRAVYNEDVPTVKLLLDLGAQVQLEGHYGAFSGTALDWVNQERDPFDKKWGSGRAKIQHLLEDKLDGRDETITVGMTESKVADSEDVMTESKHNMVEMLERALDIKAYVELKLQEMAVLDAKKAKLAEEIEELKAYPDFRTDKEIQKLQDYLIRH